MLGRNGATRIFRKLTGSTLTIAPQQLLPSIRRHASRWRRICGGRAGGRRPTRRRIRQPPDHTPHEVRHSGTRPEPPVPRHADIATAMILAAWPGGSGHQRADARLPRVAHAPLRRRGSTAERDAAGADWHPAENRSSEKRAAPPQIPKRKTRARRRRRPGRIRDRFVLRLDVNVLVSPWPMISAPPRRPFALGVSVAVSGVRHSPRCTVLSVRASFETGS